MISTAGGTAIFGRGSKPVLARVGDCLGAFTVATITAGSVTLDGPRGAAPIAPPAPPSFNPATTSLPAPSDPDRASEPPPRYALDACAVGEALIIVSAHESALAARARLLASRAIALTSGMAVYVFRSTTDPRVFAISTDEAGRVLPVEFAPWERAPGAAMPINTAGLSDDVTEAIAKDGFYLGRATAVSHPEPPPEGGA